MCFYIYHTKVWTILHQIAALLLSGRRCPSSRCRGSSAAFWGWSAFQALGMVVYALSRNVLLAIASSIVILSPARPRDAPSIPSTLMGTAHTYGALGLSLFVLVLGLSGAGCSSKRRVSARHWRRPYMPASACGCGSSSLICPALGWALGRSATSARPAQFFACGLCGVGRQPCRAASCSSLDVPDVEP